MVSVDWWKEEYGGHNLIDRSIDNYKLVKSQNTPISTLIRQQKKLS